MLVINAVKVSAFVRLSCLNGKAFFLKVAYFPNEKTCTERKPNKNESIIERRPEMQDGEE
jgi:hypothetical protein